MNELANQLRWIASRTSHFDDHITLHLAADELDGNPLNSWPSQRYYFWLGREG